MQTVQVIIPPDMVIRTREEDEKILSQIDQRVWIGLTDLMQLTNVKRDKLTKILERYRKELDIENGGPVKYPNGGHWNFEKEGILKWLKENHARVWRDEK